MIVLGADLSLTRTGLVWIGDDYKVKHFKEMSFKPGLRRMARIKSALEAEINGQQTDFCLMEDLAYGSPSRFVVLKLAELGAIFKLVMEESQIEYLTISPSMIKKHITGKGNAEKHVVAETIKRIWNVEFESDKGNDLSDAAACSIFGLHHLLQTLPK